MNRRDIQGLVYSGFGDHPYAAYVFARLGDDAQASRRWLAGVKVTSAARDGRSEDGRVQLALSATGLAALGVPAAVRAALPQELTIGMHARARVLGDRPQTWTLGAAEDPLDVLVMVFAKDADARDRAVVDHRAALEAAGATIRTVELAARHREREHFGFADGISQPFVPGMRGDPRPGQRPVALGEILLGYENAYGCKPASPTWGTLDFGANGTYLVFRKLAQHVGRFWTYLGARARELGCDPELLAAKLMGRWPSGASLMHAPERDDPKSARADRCNDLAYLDDPDGERCPIGSHVRRANPRDARGGSASDSHLVVDRHRILRRGRSYGPYLDEQAALAGRDDGQDRGLYFISLQASIARGFEFIQQTWLVNPGFHGMYDEYDPLLGPGGAFTVPCPPLRLRLPDVPQVVTTHGGGYFMLPSLAALERIVDGP